MPTSAALPLSHPEAEIATVAQNVVDFHLAAGCGLIEPYEKPLMVATTEVDLKKLETRVFVRRREMAASNPLFHSIRTRTASVVSVCFFGDEEQVSAISQRVPRIFFNVESFLTSAESLKTNCRDLLLLVKMRDVNESAHFAFSHGALAVPPALIYLSPATSPDAQPVYACVMEFVLAAIDTTIRNLGGQRLVNVDLDVLLSSGNGGLQASYAEFQAQVDVQLGLAGRTARPRRGEGKNGRGRKASGTKAAVAKNAQSARRIQKRGPVEPEYNLERKMQMSRPLDLDTITVPPITHLPSTMLESLPVTHHAVSNTAEAALEYTEVMQYGQGPAVYLPLQHPYVQQSASPFELASNVATNVHAYGCATPSAPVYAPHASFGSLYGQPTQPSTFGYLPHGMDDASWLYSGAQVSAYGGMPMTIHHFYNQSAIATSCDSYRYGNSL
jgi:hypothetical protein